MGWTIFGNREDGGYWTQIVSNELAEKILREEKILGSEESAREYLGSYGLTALVLSEFGFGENVPKYLAARKILGRDIVTPIDESKAF